MKYFVVYAADNAFLIVLVDLLANREVKGTMEAFRWHRESRHF